MNFSKEETWNTFIANQKNNNFEKDTLERDFCSISKSKNIKTPIVSEYLLKNGLQPKYPGGRKFGLCVSHDIDVLYRNKFHNGNSDDGWKSLISNEIRSTFCKFKNVYIKQDIHPEYAISETLKYGKKYGLNSSFYFLALQNGELDFNYSLGNLKSVFQEIVENNGEIGLHGGFNAFSDLRKIEQEKTLLESIIMKPVSGYRGHYLKFREPLTWELLNRLNFLYDTTYGYPEQIGFKNGMCHPFRPFSKKDNKYLDIFELPLAIMDTTLTKYMGLGPEEQLFKCKELIDMVESKNGVLSLLWHNDNMGGEGGEMYEAILKYAYSKNAWMPTGKEMVEYWKEEGYDEIQISAFNELRGL